VDHATPKAVVSVPAALTGRRLGLMFVALMLGMLLAAPGPDDRGHGAPDDRG
jgi:hypothetical protein